MHFPIVPAAALGAALVTFHASSADAVELNVMHFGTGMYGVPHAVAKEKGYFKEAGLDVTGFLTSAGGGTTVRNVLASELPYGEVAVPAVIAAAQQGLELTIVHAGVASVSDQVWITRKDDQSIKTVQDLKGKKLGYSSPKSVTDMITSMMLDANGLTGKVERKSIGGVGSGLTVAQRAAEEFRQGTRALCHRAWLRRLQSQPRSVGRLFQFAAADRQVVVSALREDGRTRRARHGARLGLRQSGDAHHRL